MFSQCPELPVEMAQHIFHFFSAKNLWLSRMVCRQWKGFIEDGMVNKGVLIKIDKYRSNFDVFYYKGYLLLHINMESFFQNSPHEDKLVSSIATDFPFLETFLSIQKSNASLTFCSKDGINFYHINPIPNCSAIYFKHPANNKTHKLSRDPWTFTLYQKMPKSFRSLEKPYTSFSNIFRGMQIPTSFKVASYKRLPRKDRDLLLRLILLKQINFHLAISEDFKRHYPMPYVPRLYDCENKSSLRK